MAVAVGCGGSEKPKPPCGEDELSVIHPEIVFANVGRGAAFTTSAKYVRADCEETALPVNLEADSGVEIRRVGDETSLVPKVEGTHTILVSATYEGMEVQATVKLVALGNATVEGAYVVRTRNVVRRLDSPFSEGLDWFFGCYGEMVATSHFVSCIGAPLMGTQVVSPRLDRLLVDSGVGVILLPYIWGLGGDGPLLGRASSLSPVLMVDEISPDAGILRTATYEPPPNPIRERLDEESCSLRKKTMCPGRLANRPNNVAIEGNLVAMTDLLGGLYLLRYVDGTLVELARTYPTSELKVRGESEHPIPVVLDGTSLWMFYGGNFVVHDISEVASPRMIAKGTLPRGSLPITARSGRLWLIDGSRLEVDRLEGGIPVKRDEFDLGSRVAGLAVLRSRVVLLGDTSLVELEADESDKLRPLRKIAHYGAGMGGIAYAPDGSILAGGYGFILRIASAP
ncbi:MAG: hypothetical protein HYT87_09450 [Nitrospirae bacterium]|nr:hypothetical protein [Nitrospirota bacterium]